MMLRSVSLRLLVCVFVALFCHKGYGQLENFSYCPNWALQDLNGNSHVLHNYLDQGKAVVLFFYDASVPPCWTYHNQQALQNLQTQHSDSVQVLYVECNLQTTDANLQGNLSAGQTTNPSLGNWVLNNPIPIINLTSDTLQTRYKLYDYPQIMTVCPERLIHLSGQRSTAQHLEFIQNTCKGLATDSIDVQIIKFFGPDYVCTDEVKNPRFVIQNRGLKKFRGGKFQYYDILASTQLNIQNYNDTLFPYQTQEIILETFWDVFAWDDGVTNMAMNFLAQGDANEDDNSYYGILKRLPIGNAIKSPLKIEIATDQYGEEITWEIRRPNQTVITYGGPFNHLESPGTELHTIDFPMDIQECYEVVIKDKYGDGVCCDYGQGYVKIYDGDGIELISIDTMFTEKKLLVTTGFPTDIPKSENMSIRLYPSPAQGMLNIEAKNFGQNIQSLYIFDIKGKQVYKHLTVMEEQIQVTISQLSTGIYFVQVEIGDERYNLKFIKQ